MLAAHPASQGPGAPGLLWFGRTGPAAGSYPSALPTARTCCDFRTNMTGLSLWCCGFRTSVRGLNGRRPLEFVEAVSACIEAS